MTAYSGDAVYLYSTLDDTETKDSISSSQSPLLDPNSKGGKSGSDITNLRSKSDPNDMEVDEDVGDDDDTSKVDEEFEADESHCQSGVPIINPRQRFSGARNVATIKDGELVANISHANAISPLADVSIFSQLISWDHTTNLLHLALTMVTFSCGIRRVEHYMEYTKAIAAL